jgi:hypothetical protein
LSGVLAGRAAKMRELPLKVFGKFLSMSVSPSYGWHAMAMGELRWKN